MRRFVVIVLTLVALAGCKKQNSFIQPPPPKVTVAVPIAKRINRYLEETGNAAAHNTVDLVARVQGTLQEIAYTDGAAVKKGDLLFVIEPLPFQTKLQQAQAAEAGAQAQLVNARINFDRQMSLQKNNVASVQNLDDARAARDAAQAALDQARANTQLAAITYSYTHVTAPFDGLVSAHLVSVGELVGTSPTHLATIVQARPIYVNFSLSEQEVERVRAEMRRRGLTRADLEKVPLEVGLQSENGFPHVGHLDYAAPVINAATGTLAVRGVLENQDYALLPGNFVRVRVPIQQDVDALLVPATALGSDQGGAYVLVVGPDDVVQQRPVTLGPQEGSLRVVETGLSATDRVVVDGLQRAVPGQKVAPEGPAPRPAAAQSGAAGPAAQ
jgi:RND family efflux transporter MFP subunit